MKFTEDDVSTLIEANARMTPGGWRFRLLNCGTAEVTLSILTDFANAVTESINTKKVAAIWPEMKAALDKAAETGATFAETSAGIAFINRGHDYGENADLECPACSGSGHVEDFNSWAARQGKKGAGDEQ